MIKAVISGDIVAYTSLSDKGRTFVEKAMNKFFTELQSEYNVHAWLVKGDSLECIVHKPEHALRIALAFKTFVKSLVDKDLSNHNNDKRYKYFKIHGIRMAIGYGELTRFKPKKEIIDGEAVYFAGRKINEEGTYNKKRIVIKNTLFFASGDKGLNSEFKPLLALLDFLLSKATAKQCEVLYMKLLNYNEDAIAKKMKITQPVVNQHSTSAGWNAIEKAVLHFTEVLKNK